MQDGTSLPLAPLSGKPGDRLHAGRDKPSPGTPLGVTMRQTTYRTKQAFPWHPSLGNQETDYKQDRTSLLLAPLSGKPGDRLYGGQRSLPLAPLSGKPGDRLHAGRNKPSPGTPLWGTRRQTTSRTGQAFPWHPSQGNQGTDYMEDKEAFPWHPSRGNQETDYMQDETSLPLAPLSGKLGDRLHAG